MYKSFKFIQLSNCIKPGAWPSMSQIRQSYKFHHTFQINFFCSMTILWLTRSSGRVLFISHYLCLKISSLWHNHFYLRCPPLFDLLVRILMGYLAGSRALLSQYLQAHPASRTEGIAVEQEREELRAALVTAQESAAIQILLEVCVKTPQDQVCCTLN